MVDKLSVDFFCIGNRSRPWETKCMPYEQNVTAAFWDLLWPTCFHSESMRKMMQPVCGLAHACPFSLVDQQKIYVLNLRGGTRKVGEQERNRRKNEGERAREKT